MEIKDIPGYEGLYQISEDGTITNCLSGNVLRGNAICISNCCRGTAQSAYDYKWEYAGMDFSRGIREQQKLHIDREIARLSKLSEQLSTL